MVVDEVANICSIITISECMISLMRAARVSDNVESSHMGGANKVKEGSRKVKGGEVGIIADIMWRGAAIVKEYNLGEKDIHAA